MTTHAGFDLSRWQRGAAVTAILVAGWAASGDVSAQVATQPAGQPYAVLLPASTITFPNETDSNSPALWELVSGQWTLALLNSVAGFAELSNGRSVARLSDVGRVSFSTAAPAGGYWFEAVVRDTDAWYGYYHNERADVVCAGSAKVLPRIGAARSEDHGRTWADLGPILETPPGSEQCATNNDYFVGGVGDFSALLDADRTYVYFYYTQYAEQADRVGVSVARMAWADRDAPRGRVDVWSDGVWLPPSLVPAEEPPGADDEDGERSGDATPHMWIHPLAMPIFPAADRWDNASTAVDVLWGPSIHWNAHLECYVMLLNRATSKEWQQGAVLVSYNTRLDDPAGWTTPARLFSGGRWYPQVVGLDIGQGTDAYAGATARFFMGGRSDYTIVFGRR